MESETRANTVWVVLGDVEPSLDASNQSLLLLAQAIKFMRRYALVSTRLGLVLNPSRLPIDLESSDVWGNPGWLSRALLLVGHPAESIHRQFNNKLPKKYMNIMAAKNFAAKITEEALKVLRGEAADIRPLSELAVSVSLIIFSSLLLYVG